MFHFRLWLYLGLFLVNFSSCTKCPDYPANSSSLLITFSDQELMKNLTKYNGSRVQMSAIYPTGNNPDNLKVGFSAFGLITNNNSEIIVAELNGILATSIQNGFKEWTLIWPNGRKDVLTFSATQQSVSNGPNCKANKYVVSSVNLNGNAGYTSGLADNLFVF